MIAARREKAFRAVDGQAVCLMRAALAQLHFRGVQQKSAVAVAAEGGYDENLAYVAPALAQVPFVADVVRLVKDKARGGIVVR